jgi:AcrR family transcriptional regulator
MTGTTAPGRDTRERILDVAWALVVEHGPETVRVADVAAAAQVTRQLVYAHFDNRAGLLTAMTRHRDRASGFADRTEAVDALPPAEALDALLRAWCDYIPQILPVARALEAAATAGAEGATAWRDRMDALYNTFRKTIHRVRRAGLLAPPWTVRTATDWTWAQSHVSTYQHLVVERGWLPAQYTRHTVGLVTSRLLGG